MQELVDTTATSSLRWAFEAFDSGTDSDCDCSVRRMAPVDMPEAAALGPNAASEEEARRLDQG